MVKRTTTQIHFEVTGDSTTGLRGRQSVRTTFKLSERSIEALSILAGQLGIKQKSLFDHLVEDVHTLQAIADKVEDFPQERQRVAKTYVISRRTLENLERISKKYNAPRDALVEFSVERILPLLAEEKKKYSRRIRLAQRLDALAKESARLVEEAVGDLGEEDPLVQEMLGVAKTAGMANDRVAAYLRKISRIEQFRF